MPTNIKMILIGVAIPVVLFILCLTLGFLRIGGNDNLATNVTHLTNTIYEYKPIVLIPDLKTNGTEVCLDAGFFNNIFLDYASYTTNSFGTWISNDILVITLHRRVVKYKIPAKATQRWIIGVGYSFGSVIPVNILLGYNLFDNIGIYAVTSFDRLGVGGFMRF